MLTRDVSLPETWDGGLVGEDTTGCSVVLVGVDRLVVGVQQHPLRHPHRRRQPALAGLVSGSLQNQNIT